ncbi:MAG: hypothetical protein LUD00_13530 [Prevotellaceae bacterium]|nr:hypothetical protein [Prevotellaceae bacterium]
MIFYEDIRFDNLLKKLSEQLSHTAYNVKKSIFLILPNVKIPSPLARVKMKRAELLSEIGDSTRIFRKLPEL